MFHVATVAGTISPREFTPQYNFLAGGKSRRLVAIEGPEETKMQYGSKSTSFLG